MMPPNILLRLRTCPDIPKDYIPKTPRDIKPLDAWIDPPYVGEVRFHIDTQKCYKYTENGWKEIR